MQDKRATIMLYSDIEEAIKRLSDEAAGEVFKAIFSYVRTGEEPSFSNDAAYYSFGFIKPKLDADKDTYEYIRQKRKEAGRKGGTQRAENIANQASAKFATTMEANSSKSSPNPIPNPIPNPNLLLLSKQENVKRERFTAPTLDEVKSYCEERSSEGNPKVEAELFFDHYQANGWKQSNGNPIKDWKACVRTWERNNFGTRIDPQSSTKEKNDHRRAANVIAKSEKDYEGNF